MESTKQPVLAGGLLDALSKIFFKGLENLLDAAAEYEEEFGVLKQVSRIPCKDKDGEDVVVTIKLAPVKDKEGLYYAEASADKEGVKLDSINDKTLKLDKKSAEKFKETVETLLKENDLTVVKKEDEESLEQKIDALFEYADEKLDSPGISVKDDQDNLMMIEFDFGEVVDGKVEYTVYAASIGNREKVDSYESKTDKLKIIAENGDVIDKDEFLQYLDRIAEDYAKDNNLTINIKLTASTVVRATFIKSSKTNKVSLRAITATIDIEDALDIAYDIADNEDFADSLGSEPESYEIIETDEGYDVNRIDSIV